MNGPSAEELAATELLGVLGLADLERLAGEFVVVHLAAGQVLFRRGDPGDALYVVASGRLQAVIGVERGETILREIGRGQNVGELALLTGDPRSATVRAVRDSILYRLSVGTFERILASNPAVAIRLVRMLARWVSRSNEPRSTSARLVGFAVMDLEDGGVAAGFAEALAQALSSLGRTRLVAASGVDAELGPGAAEAEGEGAASAALGAWLDRIESEHRFLVFDAASGGTAWRRRCLRQADRILAAVDVRRSPPSSGRLALDPWAESDENTTPVDLVAIRAASGPTAGISDWLAVAPFSRHYHVRAGHRADVERVARLLTGRAVGLVLSGGAARGFAHIGVLRALVESGIHVDRIGGSSMGAVIAAQFAMGLDARELVELNRLWVTHNPLRDFTLPFVSLISGRSGARLLERMFGRRRVEDLEIPYFCTSTNLATAELMVHRRGVVAEATGASIAIPGIAPPQRSGQGDLLVDGGVLRNLPIDVMRDEAEGPIVAVDVAPSEESSFRTHATASASPWRFVLARLGVTDGAGSYPSIYRIIERSTVLSSVAQARSSRSQADVYLAPPVASFSMFDWRQLDRLVDAGHRHAMERLDAAREGLGLAGPRTEARPASLTGRTDTRSPR